MPEEAPYLPGLTAPAPATPLRVTAIVPTLNEAARIRGVVDALRSCGADRVLVVDGGSTDRTREEAAGIADAVLEVEGGLFAQLSAAAASATDTDVLLFHYADVDFPPDGIRAMRRAFESDAVVGGAFQLSFDSPRWYFHATASAANWRNRRGLGPFGDQSIFVRATTFHATGGFCPDAFFEDADLVRRLREAGTFTVLRQRVVASVRRWERAGFLRTLLSHYWLYVLYFTRWGRPSRRTRSRAAALRQVR